MDKKELIKKWKGNKRYTLKFVELILADQLSFKPIEGTISYQSQLSHLTTWLHAHSRFVTGKELPKPATKSKKDLSIHLLEFFDLIISFLEKTDETELSEVVDM